jgi:Na+/H+ antiporter NhaA
MGNRDHLRVSGDTHTGKTSTWSAQLRTPLRVFVNTETRSAAILFGAALAALIWVNVDSSSYDDVWGKLFTIRLGDHQLSQDLRGWVNDGLMTFFFFVVGLEARREIDVGELRERYRLTLPLLAGLGGMLVPVLIYLAFNAGDASVHGWGAAMSTDTAFALGVLALVGPRFPDRLRAFVLTVVVVDDIVALIVIATVYSEDISTRPLVEAVAVFAVLLVVRALRVRNGLVYLTLGIALWIAMFNSGVDPVVVGLLLGLLTYAYPAARADLERATQEFRLFREQPTPELARRARSQLEAAISPNDRLAQLYHPWTSYLIVPLFALANAGISLGGSFLGDAFTSPITLGIAVGYIVGKPVGIAVTAWTVRLLTRGRLRPPVGWASVLGSGTAAGIGFTVSLLISSLAFRGVELRYAKAGVLAAAVGSALLSFGVFRVVELLAPRQRAMALLGTSDAIVDLADPVDPQRDHLRGPLQAPITLVEYGDLECPYCNQAEPVVRRLLRDYGDMRYVWRHLPLDDVHPHARMAAEATEAAGAQGAFWEMHDLLFEHQDALRKADLLRYADELGLDVDRFKEDLTSRAFASRVESDVDSADLSGVSGTPTFFVNGRRHHGAFDLRSLKAAVKAERARVAIRN